MRKIERISSRQSVHRLHAVSFRAKKSEQTPWIRLQNDGTLLASLYGMPEISKAVNEMSDEEIRARIVELGFGGDAGRLEQFCEKLRTELPSGTGVVLRGSVVTGQRWEDGAPFDANGPFTSDLDVALVGAQAMEHWLPDAYYIPGLHTKPLGDKDPEIAPALNPLRVWLQDLVRRPVNFQATSNLILFARDVLFGEPYFTLIETGIEE